MKISKLIEELTTLPPELREAFIKGFSILEDAIGEMVTKDEFRELRKVVQELAERVNELAEAQKRTEQRVSELAEAQKKSEERLTRLEATVGELIEAQKKSEERLTRLEITVAELIEAQKKTEKVVQELVIGLKNTRKELGGLTQNLGYAFENEAYRMVPKVLKEKYGIEVKDKVVRKEISGREVNFFAQGIHNGKEVLIVGEVKLGMDKRRKIFSDLEKKVNAVLKVYPEKEIVKIFVSHYVSDGFLRKAKEQGIIVIQSFEW
uniref:DUF8196 domain-containing protein n=1 Tax=candidate division WOR-3 bacterium TaxID=2052148 RepID=A0A7C4YAS5_UNCW3